MLSTRPHTQKAPPPAPTLPRHPAQPTLEFQAGAEVLASKLCLYDSTGSSFQSPIGSKLARGYVRVKPQLRQWGGVLFCFYVYLFGQFSRQGGSALIRKGKETPLDLSRFLGNVPKREANIFIAVLASQRALWRGFQRNGKTQAPAEIFGSCYLMPNCPSFPPHRLPCPVSSAPWHSHGGSAALCQWTPDTDLLDWEPPARAEQESQCLVRVISLFRCRHRGSGAWWAHIVKK